MIAVLTGDIIRSRHIESADWLPELKDVLAHVADSPNDWDIHRGDGFQVRIDDPANAFSNALLIRSRLLAKSSVEARIAIGVGNADQSRRDVAESSGPAYMRSGLLLTTITNDKRTLGFSCGNAHVDRDIDLVFRLADQLIGMWTKATAEYVYTTQQYPEETQQGIATMLGIAQSTASERGTRSHIAELRLVEKWFKERVTEFKSA